LVDKNNLGKIIKFMLNYDLKYSELDSNIKWPENLYYRSRKYYMMSKKKDLYEKKIKILNFYCVNHHYISKIIKNEKICNSKIQYKKTEDEFYLIEDHSGECQLEKIPKKEEVKKNTKNFYMLTNLKNDLTSYLNSNPLTKYKVFKKYAETELIKLNLNVMSNENFFKNIFYP